MSNKNMLRLKYPPEDAAEFLGIPIFDLMRLTAVGHLTKYKFQHREYYLAGALDDILPKITRLIRQLDESSVLGLQPA